MRIQINTSVILEQQRKILKEKMEKFTNVVLEKVEEKTPEDTRELLGGVQRSELIEVGKKITSRVFNDTRYAPYVEYGVEGKEFNYQKPKGKIFFKGIGAGMFARTLHEVGDNFNELIK